MTTLAAKLNTRPVLPGFEHIRRFWDSANDCPTVKVLPGEFYVSTHEEMASTVLGSCIAACIYDPRRQIGGMNHFMLPAPMDGSGMRERDDWLGTNGRAARYGNDAMEQLINALLKAGAQRVDLEAKIFGGGRVLAQMTDVGRRNIEFALAYLKTEGIRLVASDVGDIWPRQVQFFTHSGKARVRQLKRTPDAVLVNEEKQYLKRLANDPITGEVELF